MKYAWQPLCFIGLLVMNTIACTAVEHPQVSLHSQWDELLKAHVTPINEGNSTAVNYRGFALDNAALEAYLNGLASVSEQTFDAWSAEKRLAFLINAYNAYTVKLILQTYPNLTSILELETNGIIPWKKPFAPLLGELRTLDDIEHTMIRGNAELMDPRIHFAVNCASVGCPALRQEAYTGEKLEAQLQGQTKQFLGDTSRNRLEGNTLLLSQIFEWYKGDFEQPWRNVDSLETFLLLYADALMLTDMQKEQLATGKINISHIPYDWALNDNNR